MSFYLIDKSLRSWNLCRRFFFGLSHWEFKSFSWLILSLLKTEVAQMSVGWSCSPMIRKHGTRAWGDEIKWIFTFRWYWIQLEKLDDEILGQFELRYSLRNRRETDVSRNASPHHCCVQPSCLSLSLFNFWHNIPNVVRAVNFSLISRLSDSSDGRYKKGRPKEIVLDNYSQVVHYTSYDK